MAKGEGDDQEPVKALFDGMSWKHFAGFLVAQLVVQTVVFRFVPELPPLTAALIFVGLFALFAVGMPLYLAKFPRPHMKSHPVPEADVQP